MTVQRYTVTPQPVDTLLHWIKSKEIAIPEIQRPFVWEAVDVRNFLDSLYKGYPVGYIILWRNPRIRTKDGSYSAGKRILIDGQQRVISLMAALLAETVLTKNYEIVRILLTRLKKSLRWQILPSKRIQYGSLMYQYCSLQMRQ